VLVLTPGSQLLEQDEYARPEAQPLRESYRAYIAAVLSAAGDPVDEARNQASKILALESRIAGAMMSPLQMRDPANTYNMMSLNQAQALVPALDLRAFLRAQGIAPPARVQVIDVNAMKALQKLLAQLSSSCCAGPRCPPAPRNWGGPIARWKPSSRARARA
jgi:putative endopeptidase